MSGTGKNRLLIGGWSAIVYEADKPQDGRIMCKLSDFTAEAKDKVIDLRVSFLPAALGETVTVRILDPSTIRLKLENLQYVEENDAGG